MKIFHSGDWHIGKIVNEFSMIEDQRYILDELYKLMESEKPEVLLIAGDIYDRSIAPVEAVQLLDKFFSDVINNLGIKILAIAGNHDSGQRVQFGTEIFNKQGLYIKGIFNEDVDKVTLTDEYGNVNFYLIPYVHPEVVRKKYNNLNIKDHNDAVKAIIEKIKEDFKEEERNIIVTHGYVTMNREDALNSNESDKYNIANIQESDSERPLSIGGTDLIDGGLFDIFDYTALGHLHGQQKVAGDKIRYSGSILKYSFSEINHKKGVDIIEIKEKGTLEVNHKDLIPKRDMRTIKGDIDDLIKTGLIEEDGREDYIQAILTDDGEILEPIQRLRAVYPNTMLIKRLESNNIVEGLGERGDRNNNKDYIDLFEEYYEEISNKNFNEEKKDVVKNIINQVLRKEL